MPKIERIFLFISHSILFIYRGKNKSTKNKPFRSVLCLLNVLVEDIANGLGALLWVSLLATFIVDIRRTKSSDIPLSPFEVAKEAAMLASSTRILTGIDLLHQTPGHVSPDVHVVVGVCIGHRTDIVPEIFRTELVVEQLLKRHVVLTLDAGSALGHVDLGASVPVAQPLEQLPESKRVRAQPHGFCLWANAVAMLVLHEDLEVAGNVVDVCFAGFGLDVVGTVVVHAVEVVAALHKGTVFVRPLGETVSKLLDHAVGVFAKVDGVCEPGDGEFDLAVSGLDIGRVLGVPGFSPVT